MHTPKWAGFILLIAVWAIFRNFLLGRQRRAMERMRMQAMPQWQPPVPQVHGQIRCPRCTAAAPPVASFCPHCGLGFNSLPPPLPHVQMARKPSSGRLATLTWILLGLIGLGAYLFWRLGDDQPGPPAEPERPRVRMHEYHRYGSN